MRNFSIRSSFGIAIAAIALLSNSAPAEAETTCPASSARCWYLIFGVGDAPKRRLYFADFLVRQPEPSITQIDMIDVPEQDGDGADHYVYTLDFKCAQKQMRRNKAYRMFANGKVETQLMGDWIPVVPSVFQRAYELACDSNVRNNPNRNSMALIGNMFRPIDVADLTRQLLWKTAPKSSQRP